MTDLHDFVDDASAPAGGAPREASRLRLSGAESPLAASTGRAHSGDPDAAPDWAKTGRLIQRVSRAFALFAFVMAVFAWPVATMFGHYTAAGDLKGWNPGEAYPSWALAFGLVVPLALMLLGFIAARMMAMIGAAERVAAAARHFVEPENAAMRNVAALGTAIRGEMETINAGVDDALIRLASVEAMIRQHVEAIERAGAAVETRAITAADRVSSERVRLIELTETLNQRADDFAAAIAQKAQANVDALARVGVKAAETSADFDQRFARLETAARRAVESFQSLSGALEDSDAQVTAGAAAIVASSEEARRASEAAGKIADAAAETAARNAANVGQFARLASEQARTAADSAIETARAESERAATAAVEFATREARRVAEAAAKAIEGVRAATDGAVAAATDDAGRAARAVDIVAEAARAAVIAAKSASDAVTKAGDEARGAADAAIAVTNASAEKVEARNKELAAARAALETENARLEGLIEEQRRRADRLAEAIATQTERLSRLAETQLREQEAAARLAEAQGALQKARAEDLHIAAEAERAAEARRLSEEKRLADEKRVAEEKRAREKQAAQNRAEEPLTLVERVVKEDPREASRRSEPRKPVVRDAKKQPAPSSDAADGDVINLSRGARRAPEDDKASANRLQELAADIEQGRGAARPAESDRKGKDQVAWRDILSATDDADPLDLAAVDRRNGALQAPAAARADAAAEAMKIIQRLQGFTLDLEARLYGEPPPALLERFERGDRNVFANRLLRLNETDVKRRIRSEAARDKPFERGIHDFLQSFERLLEDATTSATADEELEEYLSSPLGRVYLLIGATVGYFA